ncbi:MAG: PEP-CTERM sorting domain-containing protein [Desulfobacter sp.]|nr:MAG: PEP-CTERM sorting domain-containing protein [Desulfobacter sp.]
MRSKQFFYLILCVFILTGVASATSYNFDAGTAGFSTFGTATSYSGAVQLTAPSTSQIGSIFLDTKLNATSFDVSFDFFISEPNRPFCGDGLTFAWVQNKGLGGGGGYLGFEGLNGYMVEVDTYWNEPYNDGVEYYLDRASHIAVGQSVMTPLSLSETPDMVNTGWHHADIVFNNGSIQVLMDGTKYIDYVISGYAGFDAYFGFTGSTGASYSRQLIDNFEITVGQTPIPEPSTIILFGIGLLGLAGISRKKDHN